MGPEPPSLSLDGIDLDEVLGFPSRNLFHGSSAAPRHWQDDAEDGALRPRSRSKSFYQDQPEEETGDLDR